MHKSIDVEQFLTIINSTSLNGDEGKQQPEKTGHLNYGRLGKVPYRRKIHERRSLMEKYINREEYRSKSKPQQSETLDLSSVLSVRAKSSSPQNLKKVWHPNCSAQSVKGRKNKFRISNLQNTEKIQKNFATIETLGKAPVKCFSIQNNMKELKIGKIKIEDACESERIFDQEPEIQNKWFYNRNALTAENRVKLRRQLLTQENRKQRPSKPINPENYILRRKLKPEYETVNNHEVIKPWEEDEQMQL